MSGLTVKSPLARISVSSNDAGGNTISSSEAVRTSGPLEPGVRFQGTVKWFNDVKGYGYIRAPAGEEVFVHHNSIEGRGCRTLALGEVVQFKAKVLGRSFVAELVVRSPSPPSNTSGGVGGVA